MTTAALNAHAEPRWSVEKAQAWQAEHGWRVGCNFVPSTASNQLEMWQADTFDPDTIDRELSWAADIGFNTVRVYLHDMLWTDDAEAFCDRIDAYLQIADSHGIKTMFVLFDAVWDPHPKLGPQQEPRPGLHNSRWVQNPHIDVLTDESRHDSLKPYVVGMLTRYGNDPRVLAWDLYNEPGNRNVISYREQDIRRKAEACLVLLEKVFAWAREADPSQPLTAAPWEGVGLFEQLRPLDALMLDQSDIITFHSYDKIDRVQKAVRFLQPRGRPIICTEYMARSAGSTFQEILPYFNEQSVGAVSWGLVSGRSQTIYPWQSWMKTFESEPEPWFHDVFRADGTPYDPTETALIRSLTAIP